MIWVLLYHGELKISIGLKDTRCIVTFAASTHGLFRSYPYVLIHYLSASFSWGMHQTQPCDTTRRMLPPALASFWQDHAHVGLALLRKDWTLKAVAGSGVELPSSCRVAGVFDIMLLPDLLAWLNSIMCSAFCLLSQGQVTIIRISDLMCQVNAADSIH